MRKPAAQNRRLLLCAPGMGAVSKVESPKAQGWAGEESYHIM